MVDSAPSHSLRCVVVTPEATVVDTRADFVAVPLFDGEYGIAPLHSAMIGRLGYGEMRIVADGLPGTYYVDGGFVEVAGDTVTVLTNRAVLAEKLDAEAAKKQLAAAMSKPAHTDELLEIRDRQLLQSRAQLRIARRSR